MRLLKFPPYLKKTCSNVRETHTYVYTSFGETRDLALSYIIYSTLFNFYDVYYLTEF